MSSSFLSASTGLDHYIQGWFDSAGLPVISKYVGSISLQLHPPPKKNDRKHQLSLFCEGFCNIQNISPVGGLLYALHQGFTFPNWLPNVISARFKQKLYDLHVTWILMERIDGSFSSGKKGKPWNSMYPLVMTNIAMENGPFIDGLLGFTYYKWWFSMAMLVITRGYLSLLGIPGKPTYFYNFYMKFLQENPQKSTKFC